MVFAALLYAVLLVATPPERVVSLNACTDQLLIALAEPDQIAALSFLATDPAMSAYADEARAFPAVRGSAEEVLALGPDLVLAGTFSTRETVEILKRLDIEVLELPPETSFEDVRDHLRILGTALGRKDRAEALIAEMDARLAALPPVSDDRPLFANYDANGWSTGSGTLLADAARLVGYRTLGDALGFSGARRINLEVLLTAAPDVIDLGDEAKGAPALASEALKHPALARLLGDATEADIPGHLTVCGTPRSVGAAEILSAARP